MQRRLLTLCVSLLVLGLGNAANSITLADGLTHTLTSAYLEVLVLDGPGPTRTTVNIEDGATILWGVYAQDSSLLNMNGGTVNNDIRILDTSVLNMTGGATESVYLDGSSVASIDGGEIYYISVSGTSVLTISGGGSRFTDFVTGGASSATVSGGTISRFIAQQSSTIVVVGHGFEVDGIPVPYGDLTALTGALSGTLASGDPIDAAFYQGGGSYTGTITLIPEPTTALLLAAGPAGLAAAGRRRSLH